MMRDYAKKQYRPRASTARVMRRKRWIILASVFILLAGFSYVFLVHHRASVHHVLLKASVAVSQPSQKSYAASDGSIVKGLQYDFYRLLPEMTVKTANPQVVAKSALKFKHYYVLQLATLERLDAAQQVKGVLKAEGYTTFVQPLEGANHKTWYRVTVGPFATQRLAKIQQKRLHRHKIEALLSEVQPDEDQSLANS